MKQVWHEPAGFDSNSHASQEALFSLASVHPNVVYPSATCSLVYAFYSFQDSSASCCCKIPTQSLRIHSCNLQGVHCAQVATYKVFTTPSAKPALHNTTADAASLAQSPSGAIKSFTVSSYCLTTLLVMEYCECGTLQVWNIVVTTRIKKTLPPRKHPKLPTSTCLSAHLFS